MTDAPVPGPTWSKLSEHVRRFFAGHKIDILRYGEHPVQEVLPSLRVARIGPGPRTNRWTYVSLGAWEAGKGSPTNFEWMILGEKNEARLLELVVMATYYAVSHRLGVGHRFAIGEPWLPGSASDCILISLPYPFGPEFETCCINAELTVQFGRILVVIHTPRGDNVRLISARKATRSEMAQYHA